MATPLTESAFSVFTNLGYALRTVFFDQIQVDDPLMSLFNVQTSQRAIERNHGIGGFNDVPEYTGTLEYDSDEKLYQVNYEHVEYALGMAVERKLVDDDEYGVINRRATRLGFSFDRTQKRHRASVFNNAFSSSYAGGDSIELCGAHPYSPTNSDTQSNAGTSALSHETVVTTATAMMQFKDSTENEMPVVPDTLVVGSAKYQDALVIVGSEPRSGNANNDTNINSSYNVVWSPYITGNKWFLVDSGMANMYLNWYWRVLPEFTESADSDYDLVAKYRGYMRYSFGWDHWAWVYGHNPS